MTLILNLTEIAMNNNSQKRRVYLDSGVLIAYARNFEQITDRISDVLNDPSIEFVSSEFVRLEILPKAIFQRRESEVAANELFFSNVMVWAKITPELINEAFVEASRNGMSAMDALHIVSAVDTHAGELITSERCGKPIFRTSRMRVVSLGDFVEGIG